MNCALDVQYTDERPVVGWVLFEHWEDDVPMVFGALSLPFTVEPYEPGQFYKRELPCLLAALEHINRPLQTIVVDGWVDLDRRPGLGRHLYENIKGPTMVIGVAKNPFVGAGGCCCLPGKQQEAATRKRSRHDGSYSCTAHRGYARPLPHSDTTEAGGHAGENPT